jgi:hypothetical protein
MSHNKRKREWMALIEEEAAKHGGTVRIVRQARGSHVQVALEGPGGSGLTGFSCCACDPRARLNMRQQVRSILSNAKTVARKRA